MPCTTPPIVNPRITGTPRQGARAGCPTGRAGGRTISDAKTISDAYLDEFILSEILKTRAIWEPRDGYPSAGPARWYDSIRRIGVWEPEAEARFASYTHRFSSESWARFTESE